MRAAACGPWPASFLTGAELSPPASAMLDWRLRTGQKAFDCSIRRATPKVMMHRHAPFAALAGLAVVALLLAVRLVDPAPLPALRAAGLQAILSLLPWQATHDRTATHLDLVLALLCPLPALASLARAQAARAGVWTLTMLAGIGAATWGIGRQTGLLLDPFFPALVCVSAAGAAWACAALARGRAHAHVRRAFRHSLARPHLASLLAGGPNVRLAPGTRDVTVLHIALGAPVAGDPPLPPDRDLHVVHRLLGAVAGRLREAGAYTTRGAGGTLTAVWNVPLAHAEAAHVAARCALEVRALMENIGGTLAAALQREAIDVPVGIGMGTGVCLAGEASVSEPPFVVVGPAMHDAQRLAQEALAARLPILVTDAMAKAVPDFATLAVTHGSRRVVALVGDAETARSRDFRALRPLLAEIEANLQIKAVADVRAVLDELGSWPQMSAWPALRPLLAHYRARAA